MGVPGAFRALVHKHPNILRPLTTATRFDRLCIDFNGLIHNCIGRVLADHAGRALPAEQALDAAFHAVILEYMDYVVTKVDPSEVLIAVDGPAPFAKCNTQRDRRYRTAKVARLRAEWAEQLRLETGDAWDTNAISPGTPWMTRLMAVLQAHYSAGSGGRRVLFTGSGEPGEGEHKIFTYLRTAPVMSTAVWGLDADLIILGLVSGLPGLSLLREHVPLKGADTGDNTLARRAVADVAFETLSVDALRDAFVKDATATMGRTPFDATAVVRDYCCLLSFLGNDFLPHVLGLSIHGGGLDVLRGHYFSTLKALRRHLVLPGGKADRFDMVFLRAFLAGVASEEERLVADAQAQHERRRARPFVPDPDASRAANELARRVHDLDVMAGKGSDPVRAPQHGWRERYHAHFFGVASEAEALVVRRRAVDDFMKTLVWTHGYYTRGCPDWGWCYRAPRAPLLCDLAAFCPDVNAVRFDRTKPLRASEQLAFVLPPQSAHLLPASIARLMTDAASPILEYYPVDFELDAYHAAYFSSATPRLPVFDVARVRAALKAARLTRDEKARDAVSALRVLAPAVA